MRSVVIYLPMMVMVMMMGMDWNEQMTSTSTPSNKRNVTPVSKRVCTSRSRRCASISGRVVSLSSPSVCLGRLKQAHQNKDIIGSCIPKTTTPQEATTFSRDDVVLHDPNTTVTDHHDSTLSLQNKQNMLKKEGSTITPG